VRSIGRLLLAAVAVVSVGFFGYRADLSNAGDARVGHWATVGPLRMVLFFLFGGASIMFATEDRRAGRWRGCWQVVSSTWQDIF
jgi:hypothetical protein